jgi:hypothetical protein
MVIASLPSGEGASTRTAMHSDFRVDGMSRGEMIREHRLAPARPVVQIGCGGSRTAGIPGLC